MLINCCVFIVSLHPLCLKIVLFRASYYDSLKYYVIQLNQIMSFSIFRRTVRTFLFCQHLIRTNRPGVNHKKSYICRLFICHNAFRSAPRPTTVAQAKAFSALANPSFSDFPQFKQLVSTHDDHIPQPNKYFWYFQQLFLFPTVKIIFS